MEHTISLELSEDERRTLEAACELTLLVALGHLARAQERYRELEDTRGSLAYFCGTLLGTLMAARPTAEDEAAPEAATRGSDWSALQISTAA
ncbi:MAG TPA: hypothetical protein VGW38_19540 [Chloroflexota bacterium]|nr:hypothetical protein [Chloroflexota bacterium]